MAILRWNRRDLAFWAAFLLAWLAPGAVAGRQSQVAVPFRAGVVLVPIDARVADADGSPVAELTAADFTVQEDGVPQTIAHFSSQSYVAPLPAASTGRAFFIVLGRGNLNVPAKGLDALIDFVRSGLVPGDRIAVLAYLHLVEFTTDHAAVLRLLERYRVHYLTAEGALQSDFRRTRGPSLPLSDDTLSAIRTLFGAPGLPPVQRFPDAAGAKGSPFGDHTYLLRALEYLRHVDGEKHLVFLLEDNRRLGTSGEEFYWKKAAAARASVTVIQTGGFGTTPSMPGRPVPDRFASNVFASLTDRALAEQTGGQVGLYEDAAKAFGRLARSTAFQYLLGYYPARPPQDGEFRDIRVTLKRRGLSALYRHGYQAGLHLDEPPDLRRIFATSRILEAVPLSQKLADIAMTVSAVASRPQGDGTDLSVNVAIDPKSVTFASTGDRYSAHLDVAVFVRDARDRLLADKWERVDLDLDANAYARLRREGIQHAVTMSLTARPARVKVVVYEYDADRVAYASARVR